MIKKITFLFFTLITSVIIAQTATVNGTSYSTLADAYTAAAGGDIIVIDGIFDENLTSNKAVSLQGDDPATDGIVFTGTGRVLFYSNSVSGDFGISNLTISGGNVGGNGGGLLVDKSTSSQITLSNLIVENNSSGSNGGGISIVSANVNINNVISRNNSANNGGGFHVSVVNGEDSTSGANKIINISHSLINNNTSTLVGGAFYIYAGGIALNKTLTINMENTTMALNSATTTGGIGYAVGGQLADGSGLPSLNLNMTHVTCGRNTATGNATKFGLYFNRTHGSAANNVNFNAYNSIFVGAGTITARGINFAFAQSPNFINNVTSNLNNTQNIANNINNVTGRTAGQIGIPTALTDQGGFSNVLALTSAGDAVDHCTSATGTTLPELDQRGYTRDASADAGAFELGGTLPVPVELPITFEDGQAPSFGDFNGSNTIVIPNPDAAGNESANVAQNIVPANLAFAGVNFPLDTEIDITVDKGFNMSVWSPVANTPILLKLENATTGVNVETTATTTSTGAWETISFDFSAEGDLTFESVTVFMNFNVVDPADQTYYWDNLFQGEPLDVTQNDLVDIAMYPNPATSVVTLDASQEIATIQIMNLLGQTVSIIEVNNTTSTINVSQFSTGVYIANVLFSNGNVQTIKFIKE